MFLLFGSLIMLSSCYYLSSISFLFLLIQCSAALMKKYIHEIQRPSLILSCYMYLLHLRSRELLTLPMALPDPLHELHIYFLCQFQAWVSQHFLLLNLNKKQAYSPYLHTFSFLYKSLLIHNKVKLFFISSSFTINGEVLL